MQQTLFQFVIVVHARVIDSLLDDAPYLVVSQIEVRAVQWPKIWFNESRC